MFNIIYQLFISAKEGHFASFLVTWQHNLCAQRRKKELKRGINDQCQTRLICLVSFLLDRLQIWGKSSCRFEDRRRARDSRSAEILNCSSVAMLAALATVSAWVSTQVSHHTTSKRLLPPVYSLEKMATTTPAAWRRLRPRMRWRRRNRPAWPVVGAHSCVASRRRRLSGVYVSAAAAREGDEMGRADGTLGLKWFRSTEPRQLRGSKSEPNRVVFVGWFGEPTGRQWPRTNQS